MTLPNPVARARFTVFGVGRMMEGIPNVSNAFPAVVEFIGVSVDV